jgi:hypothetical protein
MNAVTAEDNWISVGALAESFASDRADSNVLPRSGDLAGRRITLHVDGDDAVEYVFTTDSALTCRRTGRDGSATAQGESYLATSLRPGVYFVDFVPHGASPPTSVSLVLDLDLGVATVVTAELPDARTAHGGLLVRAQRQQELTTVATTIAPATIDRPFDTAAPLHLPTTELVGLRVQHRYNPQELYEHIYLNDKRYAWHCLQGSEQGLSDADRCHYRKIAPELYLFVRREKIVPTLGAVLIDFQQMKTTGKIFGYADDDLGRISNFQVGARSKILNRTEHLF